MPASVSPPIQLENIPADGARTRLRAPLEYTGSLDAYPYHDLTPIIGREYQGLSIVELLEAKDSDVLIRDLAVTISRRGVVFLRDQDVTPVQLTEFTERLSRLAGSPESSGLHIHPLTEKNTKLGDQVYSIDLEKQKRSGRINNSKDFGRFASNGWHSDISFEPVPSDDTALKIHTLPETGGDTLWASGYEIYDRLSPQLANMLEGLTVTHEAKFFHDFAAKLGQKIRTGARGSPLDLGDALEAVHPLVRTNPVTGWKSVFVNKGFSRRINELTKDESDVLLSYLYALVSQNHDAQVRFKWSKNDVAVWDNRSFFHAATYDVESAARVGDRACSLGEKPYFDPRSNSRRKALGGCSGLVC